MKNVMVIVPHPDDEVLGFGGTIYKHTQKGNKVLVVFAEKVSTNERYQVQADHALKAATILGFDYAFANISSKHILTPDDKAITRIENFLVTFEPDILYTTHPSDTHQDHSGVFKIVQIATRICGRAPIKQIFCGEIISSADTNIKPTNNNLFVPNFYEPLSKEDLNKKIEAMNCYSLEMREFPHPRSSTGITVHAQKRGMEAGVCFSEAFECVRFIN